MNKLKNKIAVLLLSVLFSASLVGMIGCATVADGNDAAVVNAERTTQIAIDTIDAFLLLEYQNREAYAAISPEIRVAADYLRDNAPGWIKSARNVTKVYKANRTPENKANLITAIATLEQAMREAQAQLTLSNQKGK